MSLVNQPAILSGAFAAEGDKNTIPANNDGLSGLASIAKGFPPITQVPLAQGGQPPQRQDFNGIFNLFSQFLLYAQNGGVYAYNNTLDYQPPAIIASDNVFYQCVAENGPSTSAGVQPVTNTTYWEKLVPDVAIMKGASASAAGASGLVPAPAQNQQKNFLTGAGVWQAIATTEQAQAGTDDSAPMTALKVAQAIDALDGNPIISASISGKIITLTKKDGSKIKLTTQDTIGITADSSQNATKGYTQLSDKTLFQYYKGGTGAQTFTWAKPFANNNYVVVSGDKCDSNADENIQIKSQTTTTVTVQTVSWVTAWVFAFGKGV